MNIWCGGSGAAANKISRSGSGAEKGCGIGGLDRAAGAYSALNGDDQNIGAAGLYAYSAEAFEYEFGSEGRSLIPLLFSFLSTDSLLVIEHQRSPAPSECECGGSRGGEACERYARR